MDTSSIALTQVKWAGLSVALINWIKNSDYFPWIGAAQTNLLRAAALVTSAITTLGIHYVWTPESRQLIFTLPTLAGMWAFFVAWVNSLVVQEITYQATRRNGSVTKLPAGMSAGQATMGQK